MWVPVGSMSMEDQLPEPVPATGFSIGVSRLLAALTALTHCLVVDLDTRLAGGERLPTMPPWHVQENKWRAARYGLDAIIILDADSNERLVTEDLDDLLTRLEPVARSLDCAAELAEAWARRVLGDLSAMHPDLPRRGLPRPLLPVVPWRRYEHATP